MRRLIVYVQGMWEPDSDWEPLRERLRTEPGHEDDRFESWNPRIAPWTRTHPGQLAHQLRVQLDAWWKVAEETGDDLPYELILIGHSVGGVLVRQAYMLGRGWYPHQREQEWAKHVTRIVLLAALNRGFEPNRLPWYARPPLRGAGALVDLTGRHLQTGSPYITDLRLRWMQRFAELGGEAPIVVQVLGDRDDIVDRDDSLDIEQFPNAAQVEIPGTHGDLPRLRGVSDPEDRYVLLRRAIFGSYGSTNPAALPTDLEQKRPVVFALHGIRASKDMWAKLKQQLQDTRTPPIVVAPSYGYFSALSFALPFKRGKNLRFMLDLYSYYFARHRSADMHFVGHSNGSYILGQALKQVPALQLAHVYLAGSVLPRDFHWLRCLDEGQIQSLRNDRARRDMPVGWLCSALRGLGMRDIGTGGVDGFDEANDDWCIEPAYFKGGHGAALSAEWNLPSIVEYLRTGKLVNPPVNPPRESLLAKSIMFSFMSRVAEPVAFGGTVTAVLLTARWILQRPSPRRLAIATAVLGVIGVIGRTL
jgi:hypothetical protein